MTEPLHLRFIIPSQRKTTEVNVLPTDILGDIVAILGDIPRDKRLHFVYEGRRLDSQLSYAQNGVLDNAGIQIFITAQDNLPQQQNQQRQNIGLYRGGFEAMLDSDVPREDIIKQRLVFLARTGYLHTEHLQIMYLNQDLLTPPRGFTAPKLQQVFQWFVTHIQQALNSQSQPPYDVQTLYVEQSEPDARMNYPGEFLSHLSFSLMMIEGKLINYPPINSLCKFDFVDHNTPLPIIPLKAMKLENIWVQNDSNQSLLQTAQQHQLLGPGTPIQPVNRVMSSFQKLLTTVVGILIGLIFNVIAFPFTFHDAIPHELRFGIIVGCVGNMLFALFIALAGLV